VILGFAAVAPFAMIALWPHAPLAGLGVLALSHLLILYPTLSPNQQWLGPVITRFRSDGRQAWLTIDDGPADDTPAVLDLFDAHGVHATFFVKGTLAAARPDVIREIVKRGHSVANHSQTHPSGSFWCLLPGRIAYEIEECNRVLEAATGNPQRWFRAPVGMKNPFVHPVLKRRGMRLIGWTARGFDGVISDPNDILRRIVRRLQPGTIIVLHQGREGSVRVLERVIVELKARGYTFVIPRDEQLVAA
jgi:peptidoglycan/xylan/chitin deacetylase (PgdA/CDA1 family)